MPNRRFPRGLMRPALICGGFKTSAEPAAKILDSEFVGIELMPVYPTISVEKSAGGNH